MNTKVFLFFTKYAIMNFIKNNNQVVLHIFFVTCIIVFLETSDFTKFVFAIYDQKVIFLKFGFLFCKFVLVIAWFGVQLTINLTSGD